MDVHLKPAIAAGSVVAANSESIEQAAIVLRNGGLVAFPTETVYGLGALAFNHDAVERIFEAKGRPSDNPLIVHVSSDEMLRRVAAEVPVTALRLMEAFWPGPLTLVLKRAPKVPDIVSAGLDTVAVRYPAHDVALALIDAVGEPIAAPSANRSGRPSATQAAHVAQDFGDSVDLILDGGPSQVGVESTVLDLTGPRPVLLRPGGVSREDIEQVLGERVEFGSGAKVARSPGMRHRHYSPRCRVVLVRPSEWEAVLTAGRGTDRERGVLCRSAIPVDPAGLRFFRRVNGDAAEYARVLFATLLEAENAGVEVLYIEEVDEGGMGLAVMDRLRRASADSIAPLSHGISQVPGTL